MTKKSKELLWWNKKYFSSFLKGFQWRKQNFFLEGEGPTLNPVYISTIWLQFTIVASLCCFKLIKYVVSFYFMDHEAN